MIFRPFSYYDRGCAAYFGVNIWPSRVQLISIR